MKSNKLIIFDWGGVVERHTGSGRTVEQSWVAAMRKLGATGTDAFLSQKISDACELFSIGTVDCEYMADSFAKYLCAELGVHYYGFSSFSSIYKQELMKTDYYKDVVSYIHSLQERCHLGVLSNLMMLDCDRIDYQMDLSRFDFVWLSFDLGLSKPNPEIFQRVESVANVRPCDILFLDDSSENITAAAARDWNVHLVHEGDLGGICAAVEDFLSD